MDDWLKIILFLIFFVLPLFEKAKKSRKGGARGGQTLPPDYDESSPLPDQTPGLPGPGSAGPTGDSSWSNGWGSWPDEELSDEVTSQEPISARAEPENPDWSRSGYSAPQLPPVPTETAGRSPVPVTVPAPAQSVELQRLQELAARLERVALTEGTPTASRQPSPVAGPRVKAAPSATRRRSRITLNDRGTVRNALIVSEILGPPLSMRDRPNG